MDKSVVLIGFYDDYARFYLELGKELDAQGITVNHIYINLSGYLYSKIRGGGGKWLPLLKRGPKTDVVLDDSLFRYHHNINPDFFEKHEFRFKAKANRYYSGLMKYLSELSPDIVLLPGEYRLSESISKLVCETLGIRVLYFEQGPYGTTLIDSKGVNANASIRVKITKQLDTFQTRVRKPHYSRNPLYRGLDVLLSILFSSNGFFVDLYENKSWFRSRKAYEGKRGGGEYVLLALQVPNDANFTHHSPLYDSYFDMVKDVRNSLPEDVHLVVREHPLFKGLYENELYEYVLNCVTVSIESDKNLNEQISQSLLTVVNNSTTGMDALALGVKVLVLGDAYYDKLKSVYKLNNKKEMKSLISKIINDEVDPESIKRNISAFVSSSFILGHFRDKDLHFVRLIADKFND
ncbi:capsular polysaccharide export protein, LipB/KpsS family [Pseudomonas sp. HK3]